MPKTFAQYLVDKCLPAGMGIVRQVDDVYLASLPAHGCRMFRARLVNR